MWPGREKSQSVHRLRAALAEPAVAAQRAVLQSFHRKFAFPVLPAGSTAADCENGTLIRDSSGSSDAGIGHHHGSGVHLHASCRTSLRLHSSPTGLVDLRLQLLQLTVEPWSHPPPRPTSSSTRHHLHTAPSQLLHGAAALAVACVMYQDTLWPIAQRLARPGYLALALPVAWECGGLRRWRLVRALASGASQLRRALRHSSGQPAVKGTTSQPRRRSSAMLRGMDCSGWVPSTLLAIQAVAGPAAVLHFAASAVHALAPRLEWTCRAVLGLLAATFEYNQLRRRARDMPPGPGLEAAWHRVHKRAAQRVAHFCSDVPAKPPLGPLLDLVSAASVALGPAPGPWGGWGTTMPCLSISLPCRPFGVCPGPPPPPPPPPASKPPPAAPALATERATTPLGPGDSCTSSVADACVYVALPTTTSRSATPPKAAAPAGSLAAASSRKEAKLVDNLPLYGRGDHLASSQPITPLELVRLVARALYLMVCFLPFFTLGVGLLTASGQSGAAVAARMRPIAWHLLLLGCRCAGAAFIKWAQWAATRGDLFPPDFCSALGTLHDDAPAHSLAHTRREVHDAFGAPCEALFDAFEPRPLASGSIAQVHRAVLVGSGGRQQVVVKVRHPGVATAIRRDFQILKPLAALASRSQMLRGLSLPETLAQFSATMTAQADLRVEAAHLERAGASFAAQGHQVVIPRVVPGLVAPAVLVESWEEGRSLTTFCRNRTPINTHLVSLGVDAYLAMLLKHNFVHTDLHPGNIMVRMLDVQGRVVPDNLSGLGAMLSSQGGSSPAPETAAGLRPQLVLLDWGLAEELPPTVRHHFISFLNCIAAGDGERAAHHILRWGVRQACPDRAAFIAGMQALFAAQCDVRAPASIDLDGVMKSVLRLACVHQVTIDSQYAALAVAVCVLVSFATSLDPGVNLMDAATPCLLAHALTGRVVGRLYS